MSVRRLIWLVVTHPVSTIRFVIFAVSVVGSELARLALEDEQKRRFVADNVNSED